MRRYASLCLIMAPTVLALAGCQASSPFDNFGDFIGDTHTTSLRANRPVGDSENMRRVSGRDVDLPPLLPEPGNVWPGPPPPEPTLEDIERQQNTGVPLGGNLPPLPNGSPNPPGTPNPLPGQGPPQPVVPHPQPRPTPPYTRGSSTPPTPEAPLPILPASPGPITPPPLLPAPSSPTIQTPQGPAQISPGAGGVRTYSVPGGGTGIVVPNGNGTSTLVGPDGSVQTVPTQK
jgi:hypothetical protein